jgi:hypothetical protein
MIRDGTRHPLSRFLVGLLSAWMVVTAVLSTVHSHQLPDPASSIQSLDRQEAAGSQSGTCFACLAAHVPLPAPMAPAVLAVPNDRPVSYEVGRRLILNDAFVTLEMSLINNVSSQIFDRVLIDRFPERRKLVRTLGWIERSAFASFMAYHLSAQHYQQAAANQAYAQQMGFK